MIYFLILLILILCFFILGLIVQQNRGNEQFENKIELLEDLIHELNANLLVLNNKVKISEDLESNMRKRNHTISKKIVEMNTQMFEEIYNKKEF